MHQQSMLSIDYHLIDDYGMSEQFGSHRYVPQQWMPGWL
jgi:hypothetical protein